MRRTKLAAIGLAAVGLVFGAGAATSATFNHTHVGPAGPSLRPHQPTFQVTSGQQKLKNTVIASGNANVVLTPDGYTPVDAGEKINCPKKGTCTIEADMSVQGLGTGDGNWWSICLVIDGTDNATCPYYGVLDSTFFDVGTQIESYSGLAPGPHTVQTQVYSKTGGWAYNYDISYHAYTP